MTHSHYVVWPDHTNFGAKLGAQLLQTPVRAHKTGVDLWRSSSLRLNPQDLTSSAPFVTTMLTRFLLVVDIAIAVVRIMPKVRRVLLILILNSI